MSMVGTFDSFTAARLGIYAAQHGLRTTGNNISNINTSGYTRQRVDQMSFKVGANDMYRSFYDNHIGSGALVTGINQVRDPYLDIRYRNISTDTYHYDTWLAGLQGIASVLDEVGKGENYGDGLLYAQLQDLAGKLRTYGSNPTTLNERLVRNSAAALASLFNSAAAGLEEQFNETKVEFYDNIDVVNEILTSIRDLNKSIRDAEIHGDTALEMRDERNRQIDALSQYLDIKVQYSFEDVGAGIEVEKLTIKLNNANPDANVETDESILVDGLYATQLSVPEEKPVLNMYDENNPDDANYLYLNKFLYRREVATDDVDAINTFLDDLEKKGITLTTDDLEKTKVTKDGKAYYLIGTNDSDLPGIVTETNDNYTIQLGKLVNEKGAAWKNTTTRWEEVQGTPIVLKRWASTIESHLQAKNQFIINGTTYVVVDDTYDGADVAGNPNTELVDISKVNTDEALAQFLFQRLDRDKYSDYDITLDGKRIIFTANDPSIDDGPGLNDEPEDNPLVEADTVEIKPKTKYGPPEDIKLNDPQYKYDEHGKVIQSVTYIQSADGKYYRVQVDTEYTHEVTLDDNDLRGILQAQRELLTEEGEFASEKDVAIDENALIKRGIPYYRKALDLLAQKFAEAYNQLNRGYAYNQDRNYIDENGKELTIEELLLDEDGNPVLDENGLHTYVAKPVSIDGLTDGQMQNLIDKNNDLHYIRADDEGYFLDKNGNRIKNADGEELNQANITADDFGKLVVDMDKMLGKVEDGGLGGYFMGGVLFSNRGDGNDTTKITAANISISADWSNGATEVIRTFEMLFSDDGSGGLTNSTQPSNINHMIAMVEQSLTYDPRDLADSDAIGPVLFKGCFNDMFSNMMAVEAEDASITDTRLTTAVLRLNDLDYSREGVSGVDLNDEAMNMVTYQKAMSAAMRLMTTIDEMLDRLINNTAV